jgi:hypothetical protein
MQRIIEAELARRANEPRRGPQRRPGKQALPKDPILDVKQTIRELKVAGHGQKEICKRLADKPRPKNATWRDLTWPAAFKDETSRPAVKSWISRVT